MPFKNTPETYGSIARFFHWSMALIIIFLLCLGLYMEGLEFSPQQLSLYGLHKSFGTLVLGLAVLRIVWKLANPAPHHLATHKPIEIKLAKFIQICLYLAMFGMPLSGWLMTSAMDYPHTFFRLFDMPDIYPGKNETLGKLMGEAHELCAYALIGAVLLHFAGALKHHVVDKDSTLRRMLGTGSLLLAVAVVLALSGFYYATGVAEKVESGEWQLSTPASPPQDSRSESVEWVNDSISEISAPAAESTQESRAITAPEWALVPEDSFAEFTVTVQGGPFTGKFTGMNGTINFAPDDLQGSHVHLGVGIPTASSGSAERDETMQQADWLDVANFPESRFQSSDFVHKGGNDYDVTGVLTLRGVTKLITFPATIEISTDSAGNKVAKMDGSFTINRLDFGVGQGEWAGTDMVANPVNVRVSVTARAETK